MSKVRIWIAGPRAWDNPDPIGRLLSKLTANHGIAQMLVMTGGAPGVDSQVEVMCNEKGIHVFACRACWPVGRHAGPVRNRIIAEEFHPDFLVALHYFDLNDVNHRGTQSAIREAKRAGIPTKVLRYRPEVAIPSSVSDHAPGAKARARAAKANGAKRSPKRKVRSR